MGHFVFRDFLEDEMTPETEPFFYAIAVLADVGGIIAAVWFAMLVIEWLTEGKLKIWR